MAIIEECALCTKLKRGSYGMKCSFFGRQPVFDGTNCTHCDGIQNTTLNGGIINHDTSERKKKCPYCGTLIPLDVEECSSCGKRVNETEFDNQEAVIMDYSTHEPSFLHKLLNSYWFAPKSYLLKRFIVKGENIQIETMDYHCFSAPISECEFGCHLDNVGRHEIRVRSGKRKTIFVEIPGMLSDDEWHDILDFCSSFE